MGFNGWIGQVLDATRFLSRLPLPQGGPVQAPLAVTLRAAPWAGVLIAAGPAVLLVVASRAGLPSFAAAALAVMALVAVTGGLHEDGLADVADGFGGGASAVRKLAIMRDSRIGAYGALAIGASLLLRVAALQGLVDRAGSWPAALVLVAAAALSRGLMLVPLRLLPPARADGLGHAAGPDGVSILVPALAGGLGLGAILALRAEPDGLQLLAGLTAGAAAALGMTRHAQHHIGGVTGDVIGATQQVVEVTFLLVLCAGAALR